MKTDENADALRNSRFKIEKKGSMNGISRS
jgi:hypothetical protein